VSKDTLDTKQKNNFPEWLRILPLADCVVFPGAVIPLLIDDPVQVRVLDEALNGDCYVGVVTQRDPDELQPQAKDLVKNGCLVRIRQMVTVQEKLLRIRVEGIARFTVERYKTEDIQESFMLRAKVVYHEDKYEPAGINKTDYQVLTERLTQQFDVYAGRSVTLPEDLKLVVKNTNDPAKLTNLVAFALPIPVKEKLKLLAECDVQKRFKHLFTLLNQEIKSAQLADQILKDTNTSLSRIQREGYLREQLKAIHKELGDDGGVELLHLRGLIKKSRLSEEAMRVARHEIDRLAAIPFSSPEYAGTRNYLDWILNLPWRKEDQNPRTLVEAKRILNRNHYGLETVKDRLLEYMAVMKVSDSSSAPILCLVGPPGVGKTSLGESIAEALGRKFCRIALGGAHDVSEIRGHRRTYVSAQPGKIIQNLRRLGTRNPVILLDEIDKIGNSQMGAETASALLELLDPNQNSTFTDNFLGMPFDLSHVLFIATANWLEPIHPALRDRMEILEIPGYTFDEKCHIAVRHIIPDLLKKCLLPANSIRFEPGALKCLIESYTHEGGVREMERQLASVIRKIVRMDLENEDVAAKKESVPNRKERQAIHITAEKVSELLGHERWRFALPERIFQTGVALGLGWTPGGGDVIPVEATRMSGRGELILTGNLGKVLMESIRIAISFLRSEGASLGIDLSGFAEYDIHVHVPAGAIAKDGPSAGLTVATALASLFSGRRVRSSLSMTGEITLRGKLLPVSGIREKVLASTRLGIKEILLPEGNRSDWSDLPSNVKKQIKARFFKNTSEAILYALSE